MSWNNILKTDACVSETKEIFHDFLQKLGANNELLEGLKNANGEELREMIEDIMRTSKHDSHKQVCKKLLRSWDICVLEVKEELVMNILILVIGKLNLPLMFQNH